MPGYAEEMTNTIMSISGKAATLSMDVLTELVRAAMRASQTNGIYNQLNKRIKHYGKTMPLNNSSIQQMKKELGKNGVNVMAVQNIKTKDVTLYFKGKSQQAISKSLKDYITDKDFNLRDDRADKTIKSKLDKNISKAKTKAKEHNKAVAKEKSQSHNYSKKTVKER